jgi:hypothetical protein
MIGIVFYLLYLTALIDRTEHQLTDQLFVTVVKNQKEMRDLQTKVMIS